MPRSSSVAVQNPGETPGADDVEQVADLTALSPDDSPEVAALKAKLAAAEARNAEMMADAASKARSGILYEPETPHGTERLKASATRGMTVAQVMAAIDARKLDEPMSSYLCADGNYCRRG